MPVHLIALWLAGCGAGGGADSGPPMPDPGIELGTGTQVFEPLADGDTVYVVFGPQGGYHVDGSMRVWGVDNGNPDDLGDPDNPTTWFRVFDGDVQVDAGLEYVQGIKPVPGEPYTYEMVGRRVILDIDSDAELAGHEIRMEVEFLDALGNHLTDARTLVAQPHPLNR